MLLNKLLGFFKKLFLENGKFTMNVVILWRNAGYMPNRVIFLKINYLCELVVRSSVMFLTFLQATFHWQLFYGDLQAFLKSVQILWPCFLVRTESLGLETLGFKEQSPFRWPCK